MTDYAGNVRRNCIYQRAKGTDRDNGYPEGEHTRDCDLCQGANEIDRLTSHVKSLESSCQDCPTFVQQDGMIDSLTAEMRQLQAVGDTMRISLQVIAKHYTPNCKPGDTHQSTQSLSGIARDALLVAEIRATDSDRECQIVPTPIHIKNEIQNRIDRGDYDIPRRIAERGLAVSQGQENSEMIDLWQHMLDELARVAAADKQDQEIALEACPGCQCESCCYQMASFDTLLKDYRVLHQVLFDLSSTHSNHKIHDALAKVNECWSGGEAEKNDFNNAG